MAKGRKGVLVEGADLYKNTMEAHAAKNWALNPTFEGVNPHMNLSDKGDNLSVRKIPGKGHKSPFSR